METLTHIVLLANGMTFPAAFMVVGVSVAAAYAFASMFK